MNENKFINEQPEKVVLTPDRQRIEIIETLPQRAYGLFDSESGKQIGDFISGKKGQVEFNNLSPNKIYDIGIMEKQGEEKPEFQINWNEIMRDGSDFILNNPEKTPIVYPGAYRIIDNGKSFDNQIYSIVDDNNKELGQVTELSPANDKPGINFIRTLRIKDDK